MQADLNLQPIRTYLLFFVFSMLIPLSITLHNDGVSMEQCSVLNGRILSYKLLGNLPFSGHVPCDVYGPPSLPTSSRSSSV
jgi:hypothetical protein